MKILIATTHLPPISGGAERVAWETAIRLGRKHDVHILTTGKKNSIKKEAGIIIHSVPKITPLILYYSTFGRKMIKDMFENYQFDILHCHMAGPWGWVLSHLVKYRKLIVTTHGSDVFPTNWKRKRYQ